MVAESNSMALAGTSSLSIQFNKDQIELVKRTVAKNSTDDELQMFLYLAQRYGLDPFQKEIWFIKRAKKDANGQYDYQNADGIIMTSRDGYLKIAQNDPDYDGIKSFVVKEGDHFEIDAMTDQISHKFGMKRGGIIGAWAIAYHKKRKPVIAFVDFKEYNDSRSNIWQKYPSAMIQKVAEVFVLKRQFSINGLVTQEEIGTSPIDVTPRLEEHQQDRLPAGREENYSQTGNGQSSMGPSQKQVSLIWGKAKEKGLTNDEVHAIIQGLYKVQSVKELTGGMEGTASDLITLLMNTESQELKALAQANSTLNEPANPKTQDLSDDDLPF